MNAYSRDLAYIHDSGFGDFAKNAAPGIIAILKQHGIKKGLVVDLGCGSGILAQELLHSGYEVYGVDQSAWMIRLARKKAPQAGFAVQSFYKAKLPSCSAVISTGECINYLFDNRNNSESLLKLFRKVNAALAPGGLFLFDLLLPGQQARTTIRSDTDWDIFAETSEDPRSGILTRRMIFFRKSRTRYVRSEEVHRQKLFPAEQVLTMLQSSGFHANVLTGYGKMKLPRHSVFAATKKS